MNTKKYFLFSLLLVTSFLIQAQNPVGVIPGVIDVSPMGAATYTIPIEVVPGTQGMQPNLSIVYNSFGGMGLLGMKWNLAGVSAITRCGQTPYFDVNATSIQFTESDRFTLDGERLINIGSQSNIEYATEIENFTRIFKQTSNAVTSHFFAYTDDGSIIEYGNTPESKQQLGTTISSILSWFVNKVTDANGNYMLFSYGKNDREVWINEINYTYNPAAGISTPFAKVQFGYVTLPDTLGQNNCFVKGYSISQTKLLKTITVFSGSARVRKYEFNYDHTGEQSAHLKNVVMYGETDTQYLKATTIEWGAKNAYGGPTNPVLSDGSKFPEGYIIPGDFNGDGSMDFVVYGQTASQKTWKLYTGRTDGKFEYNGITGTHPAVINDKACMFYKADINGDGCDELIIAQALDIDWRRYHFSMYSLKNSVTLVDTTSVGWLQQVLFGDFDGDGKTDILFVKKDYYDNSSFQFYMGGSIHSSLGLPTFNQRCNVRVGDFDGDGKADVEVNYYNNNLYPCYFNNGTKKFYYDTYPQQTAPFIYDRYSGDFNGDGITDLLTYEPYGAGYVWKVFFGKGDKTYTNGTTINGPHLDMNFQLEEGRLVPTRKIITADLDGDGKDEIIQLTGGQMNILYSKGCLYVQNSFQFIYRHKKQSISGSNLTNPKSYNIADFNNDGILDLIVQGDRLTPIIYYLHKNNQYEFPKKITDGLGKTLELVFKPRYWVAKDQNATKKYFYHVLDNLKTSNGINNGVNTIKYIYEEPVFSWLKRTFLGFQKFSCIDNQKGKTDAFKFAYNYSNNLMKPVSHNSFYSVIDDYWNTLTTYNYSFKSLGNRRYVPYSSETTVCDDLFGTKTVTATTLYDDDGRIKTNSIKSYAGCTYNDWMHSETKTYTYKKISLSTTNASHNKNVLEKIITTQQYEKNGTTIADTLTYKYNETGADVGRLLFDRKGNIHGVITTTYGDYSKAGQYRIKTVSAAGCESRVEKYLYDNTYRFIKQVTNPEGHITQYGYEAKTGNKTLEIDPNSLSTIYLYDTFGNLYEINYPDGTKTNILVNWHSGTNPPNAKYYSTTTSSGKPEVIVYYDVLGREVCRKEDGYYFQTEYNKFEQVVKVSEPFQNFTDTDIVWHTYTYDKYGRKETEEGPYINLTYEYPYIMIFNRRGVSIKDNLSGVTTLKHYDALWRISSIWYSNQTMLGYYHEITNDKKHKTKIYYEYEGTTTTIITDLWGNRLSIEEPNAGLIVSTYNKFNELEKQINAKGDTTSYKYDKLGRVTQKRFADKNNKTVQTINYIYDLGNMGKGKLSQIKINNNLVETFTYDNYGRLSEHKKKIDRNSYTLKYTYDKNGLLETLTYPENFAVTYKYSPTGKLDEIIRSSDKSSIYKVNSRNKYHAPLSCTYGNGIKTSYSYDFAGLVTSINATFLAYEYQYNNRGLISTRKENGIGRTEKYEYDGFDRLRNVTVNSDPPQIFSYDYNGNIMSYGAGIYTYGSSKPHAVTKITNAPAGSVSAVTYNFFNQPTKIEDASASSGNHIDLFYGADQLRHRMELKKDDKTLITRYYMNKYFENEVDFTEKADRYKHFIYGDNGVVALHITTHYFEQTIDTISTELGTIDPGGNNPHGKANASTDSMYYIHTDHLGSYCAITNVNKKVRQRNFFDAWGNTVGTANFALTARGFTGHEHYPQFKIINMNSRLYDPVIGSFFSPDNFVQMPEFAQAFNRYSYCLNNPLKYVDPTGMIVEYNSFRDRWNSFVLRIFDSEYRRDFRELKKSEEIYVINFNKEGVNNFATDGNKLFVNYSMTNKAKETGNNILSLLKHEFKHAVQHQLGKIDFVNVDQGWGTVDRDGNYFEHRKWTPVNNDFYKEIEAHDAGAKAPFLKGGTEVSRWLFDDIYGNGQRIEVPDPIKIERLKNTPEYKNLREEHLYNTNTEKIKNNYQYALPYKLKLY